MNSALNGKVEKIISTLSDMYPDAKCELNHSNALELLIAVMLSAQTTDVSVNKLTVNLFNKYKNIEDYLNADINELESDLRRIGLFKTKAKNLKLMVEKINSEYNNKVPSSQKELESLAGVGRKTANVVRSTWFGIPRIAVDTHVERISKRLKLAYKNDSLLKVEQKLMQKIPKDKWIDMHHKIIFFGRYFCKSQNPSCSICKLKDICRGA